MLIDEIVLAPSNNYTTSLILAFLEKWAYALVFKIHFDQMDILSVTF